MVFWSNFRAFSIKNNLTNTDRTLWMPKTEKQQSVFQNIVLREKKKITNCSYFIMSWGKNSPSHYSRHDISKHKICYASHTKYVSKLHGESFHLRPLPSRFHNSRQFSSSPFSYRKLFGSPAFQLVNVMGLPVAIQKKLPSSAKSVPDVQKCSLP